uniref:C2H2-type domain-containing protein n=1 Tax=Magallana gigas TaxID=29159 RepID=A0A8W8MK64_MAGGI
MTRISEKLLLKDENLVFSGVKQPDPKPTSIQGVKQQDHFPCIDPDCIKVFRKENQLVQHLSVGQHVYDEQQLDTLEDRSKRLWSAQCSELRLNQQILSSVPVVFEQPTNFCESHGYALKRRKKTSRFSGKVRNYLTALFRNGEETGKN